ncbi:HetZ-related protein [Microcoleus sp. FACHB-68]|uniref:HetZ-related protein n=1 Tax=Microcoleus sp. FACHB-68 TaxID=2692826 RepID=UPI001685B7EA|nr:HetZ-related protein [Microcoleus sp. FACHB-68]MBD1940201.1 HetZ-related protein [Microcoleus sp. FACHB-68]
MNSPLANSFYQTSNNFSINPAPSGAPNNAPRQGNESEPLEMNSLGGIDTQTLANQLVRELHEKIQSSSRSVPAVAMRIAKEIERICQKSARIQNSGQVHSWQQVLARHRMQKCLDYYQLGSKQGRVELHSTLSSMVYRHVAPLRSRLGFQGRYNLIEDFLQGFYMESLRAFRRENQLTEDYTPRTQLELAEYMAFTEHFAKRRINLPGRGAQQLVVLRAQGFANNQPAETVLDIEQAIEFPKGEDAEVQNRSHAAQQVREQMISETIDPAEAVLRDRVVAELVQYLESQGQSDCVDYLVLKLQDMAAQEIDEVLNLSARQRDYLQQRFKYHVEKFARSHNWKLVHQWLGADLDQNLGMPPQQWETFVNKLTPQDRQLLDLKCAQKSEQEIAQVLKCTPKQLQKRWTQLLNLAWEARNSGLVAE